MPISKTSSAFVESDLLPVIIRYIIVLRWLDTKQQVVNTVIRLRVLEYVLFMHKQPSSPLSPPSIVIVNPEQIICNKQRGSSILYPPQNDQNLKLDSFFHRSAGQTFLQYVVVYLHLIVVVKFNGPCSPYRQAVMESWKCTYTYNMYTVYTHIHPNKSAVHIYVNR